MTKLKTLFAATSACMLLGATPAQAQLAQVVAQFDDPTIVRLLKDVKAEFRIENAPNGQVIYRVQSGDAFNFTVSPRACTASNGCVGLVMIAVFTRNDNRTLAELDEYISQHNDLNPNGKLYRMQNGQFVVAQGYINAAFGISYANAMAHLLVFKQEVAKAREGLADFSEG